MVLLHPQKQLSKWQTPANFFPSRLIQIGFHPILPIMKPTTTYLCPNCNRESKQPTIYRRAKRNQDHPGPVLFQVNACPLCQYMFNPYMTSESYTRMNQTYLQFSPSIKQSAINPSSGIYKQGLIQRDFIQRHLQPNGHRHLDIGCGEGIFLSIMNQTGFESYGVEPSPVQAQLAQTRTPFPVEVGFYEDDSIQFAEPFHVISLLHVLEHVLSPIQILEKIHQDLSTEGYIYIEVPDSMHPRVMIPPFFVPEHISYFTIWSLEHLLLRAGFQIACWDSFAENPHGSMNYPVLRVLAQKQGAALASASIPPAANVSLETHFEQYFEQRSRLVHNVEFQLRDHHFNRGFWVFGAGYHSEILFDELPAWFKKVVGFLDNNPTKHHSYFYELPIHPPSILEDHPVTRVLISSISENEILSGLQAYPFYANLDILGIYHGIDA